MPCCYAHYGMQWIMNGIKGEKSLHWKPYFLLCVWHPMHFASFLQFSIVVSYILNLHQKFLQPQLSKASPSIQRMWRESAMTCSWPKSLQRMISGIGKLLSFAHESITKQCQEAETRQIQTSCSGFSRWRRSIYWKNCWDDSFIIWVKKTPTITFHSERCVSPQIFCVWFRNYWMKCDMQEVTLCDHNSLLDFKIYESLHFLLYLLNDLKRC